MENETDIPEEEHRMTFLEHLAELRTRLIRAMLAVALVCIPCLYYSETIFEFLARPIAKVLPTGSSMVYIGLPDPFFTYIKVALITALFITIPYVLFQLWLFIRPGLYQHERRLAGPFVIVTTLLFYSGAAFAFFLVFPAAFKFFVSFQSDLLKPMISIKEYVALVMSLMLAFGVVFETPIVVVLLGLLGLIQVSTLKKGRRYFVLIAFIIGAILTPTPDVVNQSLMAVPMIILYEFGIWALVLLKRMRKKNESETYTDEEHEKTERAPSA